MEASRPEASLFSTRWHRVQALRPRLRSHVVHKRQLQRGVAWYLLIEPGSERVQRLNLSAYQFVGRCDGEQTVQQIWDALLAARPEEVMSQDEVVQLLVQLHGRGLIQFDVAPDVESIFRAQATQRQRERRRGVNPLAFRLALGDPSRWLDRLSGLAPRLFSRSAWWLWCLAVAATLGAAGLHWSTLVQQAHDTLTSPRHLLLTWLVYPVVKAVHELAHGLAVRRWGGQVRQAGITLFMLSPVPFVNASAADGFRDRYQRAVVSAAGIMAELALAALAMAVWLSVQPGVLHDLAFIVMMIGGLSTVLTNGNPLLRFDGYHLFCDLLDLRNLATRSSRWWQVHFARLCLGVPLPQGMAPLPGEQAWLVAYAPLSWAYRLLLSAALVLYLGGLSWLLGLLAAALLLAMLLGTPLWVMWQGLQRGLSSEAERRRAAWRAGLLAATAAAAVAWLPLPFNTLAEGVVWLPERAQIRAQTEGFVHTLAARDGQQVQPGDLLAVLQDEQLASRQAGQRAAVADLEVQLYGAMSSEPQRAPALQHKLGFARAELARIEQKLAQLEIRAEAAGVLVLPRQDELVGSFLKQGDTLGHLLTDDPLQVRVALPQQDALLVRTQARRIDVGLAEDGHALRRASLRQDLAGAVAQLPSAALGDRSGGRIATRGDDPAGLQPLAPVVLMDLTVSGPKPGTGASDAAGARVGGRALVRFEHDWLPLGAQWLRLLQQQVLLRFNPSV